MTGRLPEVCVDADSEYETLVERGRAIREHMDGAQWQLGDLAAQVVVTYRQESLQRYAQAIGVEYGTLCNYRRVSQKYEPSRRRENLSWSHHERAAALASDAADALLLQAEAEGWNVRRFAAKVEAEQIRKKWQADRDRATPVAALRAAHPNPSLWAKDLAEASRVSEIIRDLACMRLSPMEVASLISGEQAVHVNRHVKDGHRWLREFVRAWRRRGQSIEDLS